MLRLASNIWLWLGGVVFLAVATTALEVITFTNVAISAAALLVVVAGSAVLSGLADMADHLRETRDTVQALLEEQIQQRRDVADEAA